MSNAIRQITFNNTDVPHDVLKAGDAREFGELQGGIIPVFSGKTALALILDYFRHTRQLEDKTAEVLVPPWMGSWVYMTMHTRSFPTREFNPRVRGVLLYHQWGFPQRTEQVLQFARRNGLFVIEDCAHAFEGSYQDQRLGSFGDVALFSLAKFFPCVVGGAVYTVSAPIRTFIQDQAGEAGPRENRFFKEREEFDRAPESVSGSLAQQYAVYDTLRGCVPAALDITKQAIAQGALQRRKEHVEQLRKEFDPHDKFELFEEGVLPWAVPIFLESERMGRVVHALEKEGIESGIFHFDINRNMLDTDYKECIALPCHDGISDAQMELIIRTVHNAE